MEKSMAFAVCDDDEIVCEAICNKINKILKKCGVYARTDKYVSPVALYKNIESGERSYDALFLDIDMPRLDGISLGKSLQKLQKRPDIIFVSNREDKVFESFAVRPFGFVPFKVVFVALTVLFLVMLVMPDSSSAIISAEPSVTKYAWLPHSF